MLLESITGCDLAKLISSGYLEKEAISSVLDSPTLSLEKIRSVFGMYPDRAGNNIPGIQLIRDIIFQVTKNSKITNGLCITAPHTHWSGRYPIVVRFQNSRYLIGPLKPNSQSRYWPVSFIFSSSGPLPYEWADESVGINERDAVVAYETIQALNKCVYAMKWPLGIALNFRFKALYSDKPVRSYEIPYDEQTIYLEKSVAFSSENQIKTGDLSIIVSSIKHTFSESNENNRLEQVAWHSRSDYWSGLNQNEIAALRAVRKELSKYSDEETRRLITDQLMKVVSFEPVNNSV